MHVDERDSQAPGSEQGADRGRPDQRTLLEAGTGAEPALRPRSEGGAGPPHAPERGSHFSVAALFSEEQNSQ